MATFTGPRAENKVPAAGHGYGGTPHVVRGYINITANPADGDIYKLAWIPPKFLCHGGMWTIADIDTGTEAVDIDLGWAANGGAATDTYRDRFDTLWTDVGYQADPDGFVNAGVLTGDAIVGLTAGANIRPIVLPQPLFFYSKTMVQAEANAAAATFAAGWMSVWLEGEIIA